MAGISDLLNQVWAEFRKGGITDDIIIIGQVADILLTIQGKPGLLSQSSTQKSEVDRSRIKDLLQQAVGQNNGDAGDLFDRYVLFRLDQMLPGGRYPTPRHVVQFMVAIADSDGRRVADFACGSGGLLIHSEGSQLTGAEISPEWAQLAQANASLHDKPMEIRTGNALRVIHEDDTFERILMNPPFGEKIKSEYGSRSETALNAFAMAHLVDGGRAALLAPSGLLFSGSQFEAKLRQRMVEENHLEAIVALPSDSFQPFSTLQTHLLLVTRTQPDENALTWFLRPAYDGYVSGRGRDLTQPPQTPNDLTLAEKAVLASRQMVQANGDVPFSVQTLMHGEDLLGMLIKIEGQALLVNVRSLPRKKGKPVSIEPALLLFEVQVGEVRHFWKYAIQKDSTPEIENDHEALIHDRLFLKKSDPLPPPDLYQNQDIRAGQSLSAENALGHGIVIKCGPYGKADLLGVAVPRWALRGLEYALDPDRFVHAPEISPELRLPHDILRDIHDNQLRLSRRMDQLAGWLVTEPHRQASIPSPILSVTTFGQLDEVQNRIWRTIEALTEGVPGDPVIQTGTPFTPDDILIQNETIGEGAIQLSLEIFEAMGLIVPVTYRHPDTNELLPGYRRTQVSDIWLQSQEENGV